MLPDPSPARVSDGVVNGAENPYAHMGIDSICIFRASLGLERDGSAREYHAMRAMPTATIAEVSGRCNVRFVAARKLMKMGLWYWFDGELEHVL